MSKLELAKPRKDSMTLMKNYASNKSILKNNAKSVILNRSSKFVPTSVQLKYLDDIHNVSVNMLAYHNIDHKIPLSKPASRKSKKVVSQRDE